MAKHKFVEFLRSLQENLNFKDNSTDYEIGYRCAVGSINDVIDTQCNLFIVFTENVTETNLYEEDCINNIISILESTLDSKTKDDDFDKGYKKKIQETVEKLKAQLILDGGTIEEINKEMRDFLDLDNDEPNGKDRK